MLFKRKNECTTVFYVANMNCEHCAARVKEALEKIGVRKVKIDLSAKLVTVTASEKIKEYAMVNALTVAGYDATHKPPMA